MYTIVFFDLQTIVELKYTFSISRINFLGIIQDSNGIKQKRIIKLVPLICTLI